MAVKNLMLNPFAHEYTPASSFPPENTANQKSDQRQQQSKKKKPHKAKPLTTSNVKPESSKQSTNTKKPSQPKSEQTKKTSKKKSPTQPKSLQKSSHEANAPLDQFDKESKFITIEAAIDPIRRIDPTTISKTSITSGSSSNINSIHASTKHLLEHGYERYIDWIGRSLRIYDTVTLIGMDNAIIDIVSLVTILHDRKIGVHDDVETFSMDTETSSNRITACIQVKLHPYY